ncbi:MAG TPA: protein kinase [Phycisphaerae bacterium]|nr:protein kinase [Phycisphaerae bacterium]
MATLFVACPQCHAGYKIRKEHADIEAVCRSCGHRWVPSEVSSGPPAEQAAPESPAPPPPPPPETEPPAPQPRATSPADALAAMAQAVSGQKPGGTPSEAPAQQAPAARPKAEAPKKPSPLAAMARAARNAKESAKAADDEKTDPLVGTQINGFKIQARIGSGGFGVVYKAFDTNLERSVAIKMLPPRIAQAGEGVVERFLREARSAAKLAHPNIVTIHQICPYQDTYYIVMELVDGGALHEYLASRKRLPPAEATRIMRAAAEGLGHAHRRGIIHRDIKPGNIMLTNDGQVKVSDFGLARDVLQGHDIVGAGHSLGTPRYMAPEQALGDEPTAASDLYSLASTYYALLTGHAAYDAPNDREIMRMQVQAAVPDPRQHVPDLPVAAFRFFEKAMAKQPEDRYVTAEEFIAALDRLDFTTSGTDTSDSQALISQLGAITSEDRGAHLNQALGRAVRRAQRQRTPMPEDVVENVIGAGAGAARKGGWKIWLIIGGILVLLIVGAIATALVLSYYHLREAAEKELEGLKPPVIVTPGETPATPGETPTTPGETPTAPPKPPRSPLEEVAQEVLNEVKPYEKDLDTPVYELIRMYQENVINVYPGTEAAKEAEAAIKRLREGKRDEGGAVPEKPPETPAEKPDEGASPETPAEKPKEETPEKPAEEANP